MGTGPYPYNYRIIDGHIHAGGHPLNPTNAFSNTDAQVLSILNYLKSKHVAVIIDFENTKRIQDRYQRLLNQAQIKRIHIPLNDTKLPNKKEWATILNAMKNPVYVHCRWGADRTGMVIGRYLVEEKHYLPKDAYDAVISGGTHAGVYGGLKKYYKNFRDFIYYGCN